MINNAEAEAGGLDGPFSFKELKPRALECATAEYDQLDEEFQFLDEFLKARVQPLA